MIPINVLNGIIDVIISKETDMLDLAAVIEIARSMQHDETAEWLSNEDNMYAYRDFICTGTVGTIGATKYVYEIHPEAVECDDCGELLNGDIGEDIFINNSELTHAQKVETGITESKSVCSECFNKYAPHLNINDYHRGV